MIAVMCSSIAFANNSNSISIYGYDTQEYLNFYNEIKDIEFAGDGSIYVTMHHDVSDVERYIPIQISPSLISKLLKILPEQIRMTPRMIMEKNLGMF